MNRRRHNDRLPSQRIEAAAERAGERLRAALASVGDLLRRNDNDVLLFCCGAALAAIVIASTWGLPQ